MKHVPLISVIIVNYNGKDLLKACLESIKNQTFQSLEIIVIDNSSSDGSVEFIKSAYPDVKIIPLQRNIGFGGANNAGLKEASGDYIMLLNNDTEADRECIRNLYETMEAHPEVGICASKMIVYGQGIIDSAGDGFSSNLKCYKRGEGLSSDLYAKEEYVFGACAGAALYRKKMIEEIGFFDESFFLIHEDSDLNCRAQIAGWKVLYVPNAVVHHKVRSTIGNMSDMAIYYSLRNIEYVRIKNIPLALFLRCFPEIVLSTISEFIYYGLRHKSLGVYLRSKIDVIRNLKKMLLKRKKVLALKKVDTAYLTSIMTPIWAKEFLSEKGKKLLFR